MTSKIRVAVLRGGPSQEYEHSLKTGANVLSILHNEDKYKPLDIFISRDGHWHKEGVAVSPSQALRYVDVVFNAMHGAYGEDGGVQRELESMKIPFTGSSSVASSLSMDKEMSKRAFSLHSLNVPKHELIREDVDPKHLIYIFRTYLHPVMVKPATSGSSIGARLAHSFQELEEAVRHALQFSKKVLVEELIKGKEATCGVVENARGENLYALLPVEVSKGGSKCPGNFSSSERQMIEDMSRKAHRALGLRHYSSSDFVISPSGKIYILETDSQPVFHEESHIHNSLDAVGWHPRHFVDHVISLALQKS